MKVKSENYATMTCIGTLCIRRGITLVTEESAASGYRQAAGLGYHKGCTTIWIPQASWISKTNWIPKASWMKYNLATRTKLDVTTICLPRITFLSKNIIPSDSVTIIHNACC